MAQQTGVLNGTDLEILVDLDGNLTQVARATSHTLSVSEDLRDTTSKDSGGWSENAEGLRSWTVSIEALFVYDKAENYNSFFRELEGRNSFTVRFTTEQTGDIYYEGTARITSLEAESPTEDNVTYSVEMEGSGTLYQRTVT